jgi:prephenate dehydrogenase
MTAKTVEISRTRPGRAPADEPFRNGDAILSSQRRRIGVVGLGHMGEAFARNLLSDGHRVRAFDRNPLRAAALREDGAEAVEGLATSEIATSSSHRFPMIARCTPSRSTRAA